MKKTFLIKIFQNSKSDTGETEHRLIINPTGQSKYWSDITTINSITHEKGEKICLPSSGYFSFFNVFEWNLRDNSDQLDYFDSCSIGLRFRQVIQPKILTSFYTSFLSYMFCPFCLFFVVFMFNCPQVYGNYKSHLVFYMSLTYIFLTSFSFS